MGVAVYAPVSRRFVRHIGSVPSFDLRGGVPIGRRNSAQQLLTTGDRGTQRASRTRLPLTDERLFCNSERSECGRGSPLEYQT